MMPKAFILAVAWVVFLRSVPVRADGGRYTHPTAHYSLQVPEGWRELPPAQVKLLGAFAARQKVRATELLGFQARDHSAFGFPCLVIQHYPTHGFNPPLNEVWRQVAAEYEPRQVARATEKMAGLVRRLSAEPPVLDWGRSRVSTSFRMDVALAGESDGLSVRCLGKETNLQLLFYSHRADWPANRAVFQAVADSLTFAPGYEYVPPSPAHVTGSAPVDWEFGLVYGVLLGLVIAGVYGVKRLVRKWWQPSTE